MNNTFFITGTDTGIGKTFVTCILMQFIKFHHKRVIGMKPIAAGVDIKKGEISNEDVNLLQYESSLKLKVTKDLGDNITVNDGIKQALKLLSN